MTEVSLLIQYTIVMKNLCSTDEDLVENCGNESEFEDSGDEERGIGALKGIFLDKYWII